MDDKIKEKLLTIYQEAILSHNARSSCYGSSYYSVAKIDAINALANPRSSLKQVINMALTINDLSKKLLKDRDIEILKEIKMLDWINELSSINRLMFSVLEKLCTHDFYRYSLVEALQLSITVLGKSCLPKKEQFAIDEWIRLAGKVDENFRTSMWHSIEGFDPDRNYIDSLQVLVKHGMVQIFEIGEYLPINDDDVKFVFDQLEKGRMSRTLQLQINPAMPSLYH